MSYELTRRDAIAALAAAGAGMAGCVAPPAANDDATDAEESPLSAADRERLVAAADVLYPEDVGGIETFVERYADGLATDRPDHVAGIERALAYLDEYCVAWYDARFPALSPADREEAFRRMGLDETEPDPAGSDEQRLRYYVIEELLFALYASPTGGELVGIENPPGHPGGLASYRRGSQS